MVLGDDFFDSSSDEDDTAPSSETKDLDSISLMFY